MEIIRDICLILAGVWSGVIIGETYKGLHYGIDVDVFIECFDWICGLVIIIAAYYVLRKIIN